MTWWNRSARISSFDATSHTCSPATIGFLQASDRPKVTQKMLGGDSNQSFSWPLPKHCHAQGVYLAYACLACRCHSLQESLACDRCACLISPPVRPRGCRAQERLPGGSAGPRTRSSHQSLGRVSTAPGISDGSKFEIGSTGSGVLHLD